MCASPVQSHKPGFTRKSCFRYIERLRKRDQNTHHALQFSRSHSRHRRVRSDRCHPAPGGQGKRACRKLRRRKLVTRCIHRYPPGWQSPHEGNLVVRGYFPRAVIRSAGDVHSHAGPEVGARGYLRQSATGIRSCHYIAIDSSSRGASSGCPEYCEPDDDSASVSCARNYHSPCNEAVAES